MNPKKEPRRCLGLGLDLTISRFTNSLDEHKCGVGGGGCGVSANECSCSVHTEPKQTLDLEIYCN